MAVGAAGVTPSALAASPSALGPFRLPAPASVEVTVVEETCREPEDLRPLEEPAEKKKTVLLVKKVESAVVFK